MKAPDLRPCDACSGPLVPYPDTHHTAGFYVVRVSLAALVKDALHRAIRVTRGSPPDDHVMVFGDEDPALQTELLICPRCMPYPLNFASLCEQHAERKSTT